MNVFVTGGAGFIGSHLTERLVAEGHKVHIFDNLHRNAIKYSTILENPAVTFTQGDILDKEQLKKAMEGAEMVFHMAAIAGVSNYYNFPAKTLKVNLIGTYNVLECMVELGIKRIFDMSTSETFGTDAVEVDEESYQRIGPPQDKRWCYAGSKIGGEQLIFRYSEEYNWTSTVIRPFNIYGPRQIGEGAIANFCKNVLEGKDLRIEGSGMALRSWCYITDFIEALMVIFNNPHEGPECFNVGNPWAIASTVSLGEEVLRASKDLTGTVPASAIDFVPMDFTEIRVRYPKVNKLRDMYKWQPQVNLAQGVFNTLKWFKENYEKN
ncbi:MAG: NAD-dependent epimerase/dehydratase family protein [Flavobacteriales bacterium]|jgi:nucleoside-diphosphate-sugar epimerase